MSHEDMGALTRDSDAAGEAVAAASVAEADPGDLIGALHPGGGVGSVSGFLHKVGGVHVVIGGVGVHLQAGVGVGRGGAGRAPAIIFVMLQHILFAVFGDEVAGRDSFGRALPRWSIPLRPMQATELQT